MISRGRGGSKWPPNRIRTGASAGRQHKLDVPHNKNIISYCLPLIYFVFPWNYNNICQIVFDLCCFPIVFIRFPLCFPNCHRNHWGFCDFLPFYFDFLVFPFRSNIFFDLSMCSFDFDELQKDISFAFTFPFGNYISSSSQGGTPWLGLDAVPQTTPRLSGHTPNRTCTVN